MYFRLHKSDPENVPSLTGVKLCVRMPAPDTVWERCRERPWASRGLDPSRGDVDVTDVTDPGLGDRGLLVVDVD